MAWRKPSQAADLLSEQRRAAPAESAASLIDSYKRLAEIFHHVLSEQSLEGLLERIADTLAELIPYDALHIYEADTENRLLVPMLARSEWRDQIMSNRPSFGEGIGRASCRERV